MKTSRKRKKHLEGARAEKKKKQEEKAAEVPTGNKEETESTGKSRSGQSEEVEEIRTRGRPRKPYADLEFKDRVRKEAYSKFIPYFEHIHLSEAPKTKNFTQRSAIIRNLYGGKLIYYEYLFFSCFFFVILFGFTRPRVSVLLFPP